MNITQPAAAFMPSDNQEPSAASLTALSPDEEIKLALNALAEREADEIGEDIELKRLNKQFDVAMKPLRKQYMLVREMYQLRKRTLIATPEELAAENAKFAEHEAAKKEAEQNSIKENLEVQARAKFLREADDLLPIFHKLVIQSGYLCDEDLAATLLMTHAARLLPTSTMFCFFGSSGSGKSDGVIKASAFLPPELVLTITSMSEQAMNYLGDLRHKYVMLGEIAPQIDGQDDYRQTMMRQLISENKITRAIVDKETQSIVWKETHGPCVLTATTTKEPSKFNDELQNRAGWVVSNDSEAITAAVLDSIATRAQNPVRNDDATLQLAIKAFQEFHRSLQPLAVQVPFAQSIKPVSTHVTVRRLLNLVLNYVRANALLHQHVREHELVNGVDTIVAEIEDYEVAYRVLSNAAPRVLEVCSDKEIRMFQEVLKPAFQVAGRPLSTSDIAKLLKEPQSNVYRWLSSYVKDGLLIRIESGESKRGFSYKLNPNNSEFTKQELGLVHPSVLKDPLAAYRAAGWAI
jgi:predicted transcriptional regulator